MTANLLSRLQGLTAPDREVDALIYDQFYHPTHKPSWPFSPGSKLDHRVPRFTESLDAAVALCERVLPGWSGDIDIGKPIADNGKVGARLFPPGDGWQNYSGDGPTPAIALLIAILTALETRDNGRQLAVYLPMGQARPQRPAVQSDRPRQGHEFHLCRIRRRLHNDNQRQRDPPQPGGPRWH